MPDPSGGEPPGGSVSPSVSPSGGGAGSAEKSPGDVEELNASWAAVRQQAAAMPLRIPDTLVQEQPAAATSLQRQNPLLRKYAAERIHGNARTAVKPGIVHFGGYQVHKEHVTKVRVCNVADTTIRVTVMGPKTKYFKMKFDKKGLLAPGMSEDIELAFYPTEWRYYYDTIEVFTGNEFETVVVPIHGYRYTAANDLSVPAYVDFGTVAIGTSRTKVLPLACKIPIDFEYQFTILSKDEAFEVTPLHGLIPADAVTNVAITYMPTRHKTSTMAIQLDVAQFDFKPVTINLLGNCIPDPSKEETLAVGTREYRKVLRQRAKDELAGRIGTLLERKANPPEDKEFVVPVEEKYKTIEDIKFPVNEVYGQHHTNFVMNQTAGMNFWFELGKMPLQDLAEFIKEQRAQLNATKAKAEAGENVEEDDDNDVDRQAKELRFEMRFRELELYDSEKELKGTTVCVGEVPPSKRQRKAVQAKRDAQQQKLLLNTLTEDVNRFSTEESAKRVAVPVGFRSAATPCWDEYANDSFSIRLQIIDRFVRAGTKCMAQCRASRRLRKLLEAIRAAGVVDRESCKVWVEQENKAAAVATAPAAEKTGGAGDAGDGGSGDFEGATSKKQGPSGIRFPKHGFVLPTILPTSESALASGDGEAASFDFAPVDNFLHFWQLPLRERRDYEVFEYKPLELPPPAAFMHSNKNRREPVYANFEDLLYRGPCGNPDDGAEEVQFEMPDLCLAPPEHDPLKFIIPDTSVRTFAGLPTDFTECDLEMILNQPPPLRDFEPVLRPQLSLGGCELLQLERPWCDGFRVQRQCPDPLADFDPLPVNCAEGGGSMGPKIGGDVRGEVLNFMPVKGVPGNRDIPSDTDSDGRDEGFALRKPRLDRYLENVYADFDPGENGVLPDHSYELVSELWAKQAHVEDVLEKRNQHRARRVRDRIAELNTKLKPEERLFLG
eukprot:gene214-212_t